MSIDEETKRVLAMLDEAESGSQPMPQPLVVRGKLKGKPPPRTTIIVVENGAGGSGGFLFRLSWGLLGAILVTIFWLMKPVWMPAGVIKVEGTPVAVIPGTRPTLVVANTLYEDQRAEVELETQKAFDYVVGRFGSGPSSPFKASYALEPGCGLSGRAYTEERIVQVFTCNGMARSRSISIMAHEIVHQLQHDKYGDAHLKSDQILLEGMATWASGEYWLGGYKTFKARVQAQRASGVSYPLATNAYGQPFAVMDQIYYQNASFIEFLLEKYGREKLDQVYVTGSVSPGSSNYKAVYGKGLEELEKEWIAWLDK